MLTISSDIINVSALRHVYIIYTAEFQLYTTFHCKSAVDIFQVTIDSTTAFGKLWNHLNNYKIISQMENESQQQR